MTGQRAIARPHLRDGLLGWIPDTSPLPASPRCGKTLALDGRYERGGIAGDPGNPPACGRPDGHNGPCRSAAALARYAPADTARITAGRRAGRYRYADRRRSAGTAA